jgi:MFS family permease
MAAQFVSIGALAPVLQRDQNLDLGQIGILIGLYLAPGIFLAVPSGALASKIGDRNTIILSLILMVIGGSGLFLDDFALRCLARVVAGSGGVVLSVVATKLIADLFEDGQLSSAMGVFVISWPAGIALGLLLFPAVFQWTNLDIALLLNALLPAGALLMTAIVPVIPKNATSPRALRDQMGLVIIALVLAGSIWGALNAAFATMFSFVPTVFVEHGVGLTSATASVSTVLWLSLISIPLGAFLSGKARKPMWLILIGISTSAALTFALVRVHNPTIVLILIGIVSGLPGAAIMSLPARVLKPQDRAMGMAIFYTIYYFLMLTIPSLQGYWAKVAGSSSVNVDMAAALLTVTLLLVLVFELVARRIESNRKIDPSLARWHPDRTRARHLVSSSGTTDD